MNRVDKAAGLHGQGANCAQAVLCAFAGELGLDAETAMRAATGFGGGMGRLAGTCGAVTGAIMAIGLARGMRAPGDQQAKESAYGLVREFARRFAAQHETLSCRELLGVDIGTPEGRAQAKEANLFATRCDSYIRDAVAILEQMLRE
jgi:C_GCAxxG_C_C family probable redox protein